ncbi:MAG: hypothetical protein WBC81_10185, partial [Chitinophagaceae bacterium]
YKPLFIINTFKAEHSTFRCQPKQAAESYTLLQSSLIKKKGRRQNRKGGGGWQSLRSNGVCLDFFVSFCIKAKRKARKNII